uniref:Cytochrome P450 2M1-like n=1 Tax=Sinocyclocheilus grahami TaxID=75366 RepID=A0A672RFZ3_SINGR
HIAIYIQLLCIIACTVELFQRKQSSIGQLPPGPTPYPLLGNILQIDLSKKYGSVFTIWLANSPVVIISGYQALKDTMIGLGEEFSGRATYPLLMKITLGYGRFSREMRRFTLMTLKYFGMVRRSIEERVREEAEKLVEMFKKCSAFSPADMLSNTMANVICSIVFGQRFEFEDPQFKFLLQTVNSVFTVLNSPIGQVLYSKKFLFSYVDKAREYCKRQAKARINNVDPSCPQDLIDAFVLKIQEEKYNPDTEYHFDNLISLVWNLFSAGTETTSSTVRHALLLMMKHPDVQERVQKEIDEVVGQDRWSSVEDRQNLPYTDAVIHEIQRNMDLAPIAVPHKMMCDTEYNGYVIPKGVMVFPLLSSMLIDPKMWKNPDCFDPENFLDADGRFQKNDAFVVFGMGKRACLGEALARIELFIFFTYLLQHFTFKATVPLEELDTAPTKCSFGRMPRTYDCYAIPRK